MCGRGAGENGCEGGNIGERAGRGEAGEGEPAEEASEENVLSKMYSVDFPGGPVIRAPCFHCRGHGFDPWSGN